MKKEKGKPEHPQNNTGARQQPLMGGGRVYVRYLEEQITISQTQLHILC
jgi:hypothetical protein